MIFNYKCESCKNRSICKRYDDLNNTIECIKNSEDRRNGYGTDVMIDLGKKEDGLIFELQCDLFRDDQNVTWGDIYRNMGDKE